MTTASSPLISIEALSVEFASDNGWLPVTHDVTFSIDRGEALALVGESGSGKSVTAMSILNLLPDNARRRGCIIFDGEDLVQASDARLRQLRGNAISTIFQEPMTALNPVYRIGDQLVAAIRAHRRVSPEQARARAVELLGHVDLPNPELMMRRFPHEISGGQRQRAMIAMAISADPQLIVADEATTALDVTVQAEILDLLLDLQKELDMALLFITHDMGVVADVADRVVVMRDGRVVEEGAAEGVFRNPQKDYTRELLAAVPRLGEQTHTAEAVELVHAEPEPLLTIEDLEVTFRGASRHEPVRAVDGVSFTVSVGEMVGLVGESGSGKSTIGRVVVGLQKETSGLVDISGTAITGHGGAKSLRGIRRDVSIVFQDPGSSLDPRQTIGYSITAPLRWMGIERRRTVLRDRAGELLERVRIPADWRNRYPHELSGGQRQRVGIARALATGPKLLVADEPTSALDVSVQATVLELLVNLQTELGFSCLFVSHDLAVVESIADRVIVLRSGKIVEEGSAQEILRSPEEEYTQRLIAAVPVPDPRVQRQRRDQRREGRTVKLMTGTLPTAQRKKQTPQGTNPRG